MKRTNLRETSLGALVAIVLLVVATSPFWAVMVIRQHVTLIVNDSIRGLAASSLAAVSMSDGFVETAIAFASTDPAIQNQQLELVDKMTSHTDAALRLYETSIDEPQEREDFQNLVEARARFRQSRQQAIRMLNEGKRDEAVQFYNRVGLPQFVDYKLAINRLVEYNVDEARGRGTQIMKLTKILMGLQGILLIFFFVYAFFVPLVTFFEKLTGAPEVVKDL